MASSRSLGTLTLDLVAKIGGFTGPLDKAGRALDDRAKRMNDIAKKIGTGIGVAITAGIAAVGTLATGIKLSIDRMDELSKAAQRASLPTEQFTQLAYAGDLADVSMEDLTKSLGKLAKAQGDAAAGLKTQTDAFKQLGIEAFDPLTHKLTDTREVFLQFADAFQKYKGSPEIVAAGMQIFGRSFQTLIPLLKDGREGLEAAAQEADKLGITLSTRAGQQAEQFNDNLTRLNTSFKGLWQTLASDLLPYLVKLTDKLVDGIKNGGELTAIAQNLASGIEGVGRAAEAAIGPLAKYYDWLQKTGRVEGNTVAELEARRDGLVKNRKSFFAELTGSTSDIDQEIARIDNKIADLNSPFRNVISGSGSSYDVPNRPDAITPPSKSPKSKATKDALDLSKDAREELAKLLEQEEQARDGFEQMAASLAGPLQSALYQYQQDQEKLNDLAKEGAIGTDSLATAQANLTKQYQEDVEAIEARLNPAQQVIKDMQDELSLIGLTNIEREKAVALRYANVDAMSDEGQQITALVDQMDKAQKSADFFNDTWSDIGDAFVDVGTRSKGALEAVGDVLDNLYKRALQFLADQAIQSLLKSFSSGSSSGGDTAFGTSSYSSGGGFWAQLAGALFSGGRENGGPVTAGSFYQVGENDRPEILMARGKQYLIPGDRGTVQPMRNNRGGVVSNNTFYLSAPESPATQQQIADKTARKLQLAAARR